ncbi:MAG: DUF192 domain-containing protein [Haloplanus sp.]
MLLLSAGLAGCAGLNAGPATADATPTATPTATAASTPTATEPGTPVSTPGASYATTTVELVDDNGTRLATVDVWVADSFTKRYVGLSRTTALEPGQGMLFIHDSEERRAYVMRKMDFPLDIVFVAANGTITTIHHAPLPPEGVTGHELTKYSGRAKYVLEVPMGYTNRTGVDVGDSVRIGDL